MNRAVDILGCYGAELNKLADLAGDFDALSAAESDAWELRQWRLVAGALGWRGALERALERLSKGQATSALPEVAAAAFEQWHAGAGPRRGSASARARVQRDVIRALRSRGLASHSLFRVGASSGELPKQASYRSTSAEEPRFTTQPVRDRSVATALGITGRSSGGNARAFRTETAASYFADRHDPGADGSTYRVALSFGTYPYVYGGVLGPEPPGLRWASGRPWSPATDALRIAASLWTPAINLTQDARLVVAQYRYFRRSTASLLEGVTAWRRGNAAAVGRVYWRGVLLQVHQGSESLATFNSPRGPLSVKAFNYITRCFAAFFAARRAFVRALPRMPREVQRAHRRNPDPCLRLVAEGSR